MMKRSDLERMLCGVIRTHNDLIPLPIKSYNIIQFFVVH